MPISEKLLRATVSAVILLLCIWLTLPLLGGMCNGGMLFLLPLGFIFLLAASPKFYRLVLQRNRLVGLLVRIGLLAGIVLSTAVALLLLSGARVPTNTSSGTLVILGCTVEDDQPGALLASRVDTAAEYLRLHPDCMVIATGGFGAKASVSEAEAIRLRLIERGIDPNRIYLDERSTNTLQNLDYAAGIIHAEGLDKNVIVVTDGFHQYRAAFFAKKAGLDATPLCSPTPFTEAFCYGCREILAVTRALVLGY